MKNWTQIKNTAGMFDLLKGITMILVVVVHTLQEYSGFDFGQNVSVLGLFMVSLFVISGYGFRSKSTTKVIVQQARLILIPYCVTAICICIVHCICHYLLYYSRKNAVIQTLKVFAGLILGLSDTTHIMGVEIYSCGALWFLLALFWAWIMMNLLVKYVPEKFQIPVAVVVTCVGLQLSFITCAPFGFFRGMFGLGFLYIGFYCKKHKLFTNQWKTRTKIIIAASVVITILIIYSGKKFQWLLSLLVPLTILYPPAIIKIFLVMNNLFKGYVSNKLRLLGRYSIYFLCVHSFEGKALPWYILDEKINTYMALGIITVVRLLMDCLLCALVVYVSPIINGKIEQYKLRQNK